MRVKAMILLFHYTAVSLIRQVAKFSREMGKKNFKNLRPHPKKNLRGKLDLMWISVPYIF